VKKIILSFVFFNLLATSAFAQQTTINQKNKSEREANALHKALIIPFEPKLYLGEIDYNINAETKLSAKEIKYKFRDGLNEQLYKAFKNEKYNVVDLMDDTVKYKKDVEGIYQFLSYEFQKVPNQENYKAPKKEKKENTIEKGQINVETNSDNRFMNAKLANPKLLTTLNGKFKTDVFVFINQLDIKASGSANLGELGSSNPNRKIIVHYTIFNLESKEINSGIAEEEFDPTLNNPKKIIDKHFSKIALTIVSRVNKGLGLIVK
jgi:hypothetical protein